MKVVKVFVAVKRRLMPGDIKWQEDMVIQGVVSQIVPAEEEALYGKWKTS